MKAATATATTRAKRTAPGSAKSRRPARISARRSAAGKSGAKAGRAHGRKASAAAGSRARSKRTARPQRLGARAAGYAAGRSAPRGVSAVGKLAAAASRAWSRWWNGRFKSGPGRLYMQHAKSFMRGYGQACGQPLSRFIPLPTERSASAVVHAAAGDPAVGAVLEQLGRLALDEIIVVAGSLPDDLRRLVREHPAGPVLIHYPEPLGYGAGRAVGARFAASDIVLFLEEHEPVRAEQLLPFIASIAKGNDLAVCGMPGQRVPFRSREPAAILKEFMNMAQGRRDLGTASLEHCPHALSRRAIDRLGAASLAVPPVAQTAALLQGLRAAAVPAAAPARRGGAGIRQETAAASVPMPEVLMGDRLEAFHEQIRATGPRSRFPDRLRKRDAAKEAVTCE
ncbi:glycosyltransferase [Paenibacillus sp. YN15]|uniref:glycosyltransferase n=1 Tax=Paenibacillus sp. YN15 TaxID=1742774 RepID=UPI000DCD4227|nr:glycosyltransferase [Paenibacillus sp. YN15]RAV01239.1 hypothetical protein DQG13_12730 [Paenibacillus sp. YN15]